MISLLKYIPKIKTWSEKKEKFKIFDYLKLFLFNDIIKGIFFLAVAVIFGVLSNFMYEYDMIWISVWFGWLPICIIILPYIAYGLIIWPMKQLIKKLKK